MFHSSFIPSLNFKLLWLNKWCCLGCVMDNAFLWNLKSIFSSHSSWTYCGVPILPPWETKKNEIEFCLLESTSLFAFMCLISWLMGKEVSQKCILFKFLLKLCPRFQSVELNQCAFFFSVLQYHPFGCFSQLSESLLLFFIVGYHKEEGLWV